MNVQTAIQYGVFVKFVYDNWNIQSGATDLDGRSVVTALGAPVVPGKEYRVLKTIYANNLATDLSPAKPADYVTIGIIAQNSADALDIVIAVRGTDGVLEWLQDAKFFLRSFPNVPGAGFTEDGFTDMYLSFSFEPGSSKTGGAASFVRDVATLLPTKATVTVAGHSLGAALATLLALDMAGNTDLSVGLYSLASPRVGDLSFHNLFNHVVPNAYRLANRLDIVPKLPPPLFYFHIGDETELIPGKDLKFDLGCEHHLTSYLHLLGGLLGEQSAYPLDADCVKALKPAVVDINV